MNKKNNFIKLVIIALTLIVLTGCSLTKDNSTKKDNVSTENKIKINTTFFPIYEFTKAVAGKYGNVKMIMPSNVEPHDFEPSAKMMSKITDSDLVIYNSDNLETWISSAEKSTQSKDKPTFINSSKGIKLLKDKAHTDPHIWLDPVLAKQQVKIIEKAIIKFDPKHKKYYQEQTNKYIQKLDELNIQFKNMSNKAKTHTFIVQHQAFSYLANQYNLTQKSLTDSNDHSEPSAKQLVKIQNFMKENDIHYIFVEKGLSPKIANTIKDATNAELLTLNTLEQVPQKDIDKGATYISLMEENLKFLTKALN